MEIPLKPGQAQLQMRNYEAAEAHVLLRAMLKVQGTDLVHPRGLRIKKRGLVRWAGAAAGEGERISKGQRRTHTPFFQQHT